MHKLYHIQLVVITFPWAEDSSDVQVANLNLTQNKTQYENYETKPEQKTNHSETNN